MYICCQCGYMTNDRFQCPKCGYRANGLLKTMNKGIKYKIENIGKEEEIFKPVELEKGKYYGQTKIHGHVVNYESD